MSPRRALLIRKTLTGRVGDRTLTGKTRTAAPTVFTNGGWSRIEPEAACLKPGGWRTSSDELEPGQVNTLGARLA